MDARSAGPITIDTPLGDELTFHSMGGVEALSLPFVYEIDVLGSRADVDAADLLGHPATVHLQPSDEAGQPRHWNGRVTGFEYVGTGDDELSRYRLTIRPWLCYLTQSADCRIFQNMRVPDIVAKVFRDRGFSDFEDALVEEYAQREYVVQYRETDLDFVSRLMQREGIYYFFRHEDGKHTLVLADSPGAHQPAPGCQELPYAPRDAHRDETGEYVREWRARGEIATGKYAHADYDFTRPRVRLTSQRSADPAQSAGGAPSPEVYDYPGGFTSFPAGEAYAELRLEQHRDRVKRWTGDTNARALHPGATFALVDHPRDDQNGEYLVVGARYRLHGHEIRSSGSPEEEPLSCRFHVIPASVTFRPPAPPRRPIVLGPQTAVVVGPAGHEIWTDQYGRVKVQFHWDHEGREDENSSCFVRVMQPWAGSGWGAQFIPRIGHEVIVDFIEGDPDRPIITGSVYNGANMPPFKLPDNQTRSGIRSRSTPQGTQVNGNEIRFEDMKGREDLFVQAEKTQTTVVKDSQFVNVGVNRSMTVGAAETVTIGLTRALQVGAASSTTVGGDSSETVGGVRRVTVGGQGITTIAQSAVLDVGGDSLTRVTGVTRFDLAGPLRVSTAGDESRTTGGALDVRVGDKASYVYAAESKSVVGHPDRKASLSSFVYGTSSSATSDDLTIESDTSIVLKCGDTKVVITPDGVTIEGKTLEWKAGSKLAVTSPSASLTLDDDVAAIGTKVSIASSGAELALDSAAKLTGAKVQLGSGSGASASASSQSQQADADKKPVYIRTRILRSGEPAAGVAYTLVLDGKLTLSGSTTGDGLVEQEVPATVSAAELTLLDTGETHSFTINAIERVDTMLGAQQRLQRLGYYHGAVDGTQGPLTAHALAAFQKAQGLDASGELDGATQAALKKAYGS